MPRTTKGQKIKRNPRDVLHTFDTIHSFFGEHDKDVAKVAIHHFLQ